VDSVYTPTLKDLDMRAAGKTISSTVQAMKPGQRVPAIEASIVEAKKKVKESISGLTGQFMKASGETTRLMASASTSGLMAENIMDSGEITTCRAMEFTFTPMV
jgi:hypothetical protein